MKKILSVVALSCVLMSTHVQAAKTTWQLDSEHSQLHFVSIKKDHVAEVHDFEGLSGEVKATGEAEIVIDLAKVNTHIDLRDQRMRDFLFDVKQYPQAKFTTTFDPQDLTALMKGEILQLELKGTLSLHGREHPVTVPVTAVTTKQGILVTSSKAVVVNAADYGLTEGVGKLKEVANLPMISLAVPVNFSLLFK